MQKIENWPLDKFIQYARNPRKNDHAVDKIAAAIKEFGFRVPIIAKSDGLIVDGHLRFKAAKKLGLKTIPVMLADDMTEHQIKAFRLTVNNMSNLATWNFDMLSVEIDELNDNKYDISLIGFSNAELAEIIGSANEIDVNENENVIADKKTCICPKCNHEFVN
jgi:ParB-like chromosome segregation protein Spo0J